MCKYNEIEAVELPNGKTVKEVNEAVRREVERIYLESWLQGVSVPFFEDDGTTYLANPDGSEDKVTLDRRTRTYNIIMRTAKPGCGRHCTSKRTANTKSQAIRHYGLKSILRNRLLI